MLSRKPSEIFEIFFRRKSAAENHALSIAVAERRKKIASDWNIRAMSTKQRQRAKRAIEAIVREDKTYSADKRKLTAEDHLVLLRKFKPSKILDYLYPGRATDGQWLPLRDRSTNETRQIDLKDFSFLKDPVGTLKGLEEICRAEAECLDVKINFKDSHCLDVTPFMLLVEAWSDMAPVFSGGEMDIPMQKVLSAVGIEDALNVTFRGISSYSDVWAFPLMRRRKPGATTSISRYFDTPTRDVAADRFVDAIDEWLGRPEILLELTGEGRGRIKNMLVEVLENAERHSDGERRDGSWSVSGFLARREEEPGVHVYRASIGILSIGDTFSESLRRALPNQQADLDSYVAAAQAQGASQSEDTLRTLAALQDGVTSVPEADRDGRGGIGLMEMLDLVSLLGQTDHGQNAPEVCIISGGSCVHLKSPYEKGTPVVVGARNLRLQWFNHQNSSKEPPDRAYVFDLERPLPGTAISISFTLDSTQLRNVFESQSEHDD